MTSVFQEMRFAARSLLKQPWFALVAVLTLALGIGANSAIFSVVNGVLLRALPFAEADRLVAMSEISARGEWNISYPNFMDWRARNGVFEDMALYRPFGRALLRGRTRPELLDTAYAEPRLFGVLGANFVAGGPFTEGDQRDGRNVAILSREAWARHFGSDPAIVGKAVNLDNTLTTVVGVLGDFPLAEAEIWLPETKPGPNALDRSNHPGFAAVARLRPGVTIEQAQNQMSHIAASLAKEYPASNFGYDVLLRPLKERMVGGVRATLLVMFGAVGFVLLLGCANVANMLLSRAAGRAHDIAVRSALGAGRSRLLLPGLCESALIAVAGGAVGLLLARWTVGGLTVLAGRFLPPNAAIALDGRVFAYSLLATVFCAVLAGAFPALVAARTDPALALNQGSRSSTSSRIGARTRWIIIAAEVAFSVILLTGAGLMVRSLQKLYEVDLGFRVDRTYLVSLVEPSGTAAKTDTANFAGSVGDLTRALTEHVRAIPGVTSAAASWPLPAARFWTPNVNFQEHPVPPGREPSVSATAVTPGFFATMGIPLQVGRDFAPTDRQGSMPVAIVSEDFARQFFPGENPQGKHVKMMGGVAVKGWTEIIGVVGNTRTFNPAAALKPEIYWPLAQFVPGDPTLLVSAAGSPAAVSNALRKQIAEVNPELIVTAIRTAEELRSTTLARRRFVRMILTSFAGLALVLVAVGIYGVLAYSVSQRTVEIGIRIALGAQSSDVMAAVARQTLLSVCAGLAVGFSGAYALTRFLAGLTYGVRSFDAATYGAVAAVLMAVTVCACWLPARRAARLDPLDALRAD